MGYVPRQTVIEAAERAIAEIKTIREKSIQKLEAKRQGVIDTLVKENNNRKLLWLIPLAPLPLSREQLWKRHLSSDCFIGVDWELEKMYKGKEQAERLKVCKDLFNLAHHAEGDYILISDSGCNHLRLKFQTESSNVESN